MEISKKMVTLTYFSFTSLSTVGLGDYHPRTNIERFVGAFVLLFGVTITSFIMENLSRMIMQIREFNIGFEKSNDLSQFLSTLERFNKNIAVPKDLKLNLEDYFNFRWKYNKNNAISTQQDFDLFIQLPWSVRTKIYSEFLHKEFLCKYCRYFQTLKRFNMADKQNIEFS